MRDETERSFDFHFIPHSSSLIPHPFLNMPSLISEYVPQVATGEGAARRRRAQLVVWGAAAALAALFVGLVVLAPALRARGFLLSSGVIYQSLSVACHQQ